MNSEITFTDKLITKESSEIIDFFKKANICKRNPNLEFKKKFNLNLFDLYIELIRQDRLSVFKYINENYYKNNKNYDLFLVNTINITSKNLKSVKILNYCAKNFLNNKNSENIKKEFKEILFILLAASIFKNNKKVLPIIICCINADIELKTPENMLPEITNSIIKIFSHMQKEYWNNKINLELIENVNKNKKRIKI